MLSQQDALCQSSLMTWGCGARWRSLVSPAAAQVVLSLICFHFTTFTVAPDAQPLVPAHYPNLPLSLWASHVFTQLLFFFFWLKLSSQFLEIKNLECLNVTSPFHILFMFLSFSFSNFPNVSLFLSRILLSDWLSPTTTIFLQSFFLPFPP